MQADHVKVIYESLRSNGVEHVAVVGDFNDIPTSTPLRGLLEYTGLTDFVHVAPFDDGSPATDRPGSFGNGTASEKIDHLLLSPSLFQRATHAEIFRKGVWGGTNGTLRADPYWPDLPNTMYSRRRTAPLKALRLRQRR